VVVHTVVVVTGTVVGVEEGVVVGAGVMEPSPESSPATVVVVVGAVVVGAGEWMTTTGLALLAAKPTRAPESTPEPRNIVRVRRRTRAKRRSRCWGVRGWGLMISQESFSAR
jgi:hypothetical protein